MIPTKDLNPHLPITVDEVIEDVLKVASLGVSMVHLHALDPVTGKPTYKKEIYGKIIKGIRKKIKISFYACQQVIEISNLLKSARNALT
jgi:uncharacterized protein (DUF849 family)